MIPSAVEEFLRYFAFVAPARKVMQDNDFHGCPLKKGDMVFVPLSGATRDPDRFEDAAIGPYRPRAEQPHCVRFRPAPLPRLASGPA